MLELSGIARSTYYYHLKQKYKDKYESEKQDILEIYNTHKGRYGYRRICSELKAKGYPINHKTVLKLMKFLDLRGKQSKNGKYHSYKGKVGKVADNLLKRDFHADKPFEKLTTDITEFKIGNEKVYLSPVLDMFNREIVSYSISTSPNLQQIWDMLSGLFEKLPALHDLCFIPIKGGSTNTPNTNGYLPNTTLHKVCPEKGIVWITA